MKPKHIRIGITGAHSTGKTTLLNALRSEPAFADLDICTEVTRDVRALGLEINEGGTDLTQRLIMNQHIVNIFMHPCMLTDRTSLDGLIYTEWLYKHGKVSKKTLEYAEKVFNQTIYEYDILFYLPVEFEIETDGVRSTDITFQREIAQEFNKFVNSWADSRPWIVPLSGSVRGRVQTAIESYQKWRW